MSAPNCLRGCLVQRPAGGAAATLLRHSTVMPATAAHFSTSTPLHGNMMKPQKPGPKSKVLLVAKQWKKGKVADRGGKSPLPGERKAFRKRILLSNNNALPVEGLTYIGPGDLLDHKNVGKVMSIPDAAVDQLRTAEVFKPTQTWSIFRKPSMLVRSETVDLLNRMHTALGKEKALRLVIAGDRITGKSMLLLQAITHAYLNDYIVIHIPEAQELSIGATEYAPVPHSDPVQFMQPNYVLKLIQAIRKANEKLLAKMTTIYSHPDLPQNIPVSSPLLALANSAKEPESAWIVFRALFQELTVKGHGRPPILFSLDGLAHIMKMSEYRTAAFEPIHSHDLALVRLFTDCLSGAVSLPNGGAVLAAMTRGNAPRVPSLDLALSRRAAEQAGRHKNQLPQRPAFAKDYDDRVEAVLQTVELLQLQGVSKPEARSLMEYWAASGVLRSLIDEATVSEKWTLAGNGIVGEMERAALLTSRF